MKQSIKWHKECLKNSKDYEIRMSKELDELHNKLSVLRLDNLFRQEQIINAINQGRNSYDRDKFMHSQKRGDANK